MAFGRLGVKGGVELWLPAIDMEEDLSLLVLEECCFSLARGIIIVIIPRRQSAVEAKKMRLILLLRSDTDDLRLRHAVMGKN